MADTYTQIYIHAVFAVKGRENLISPRWKVDLYKYIAGIVLNEKQKLIAINGMPDHIHILLGIQPTMALSNLIRDIKANSSRFINENNWVSGKFEWQNGFGAFSYSHSQLDTIGAYIKNQEQHHHKKTFREEYQEFLRLYDIDYKSEFIFEDL
ncbi:MAG TPA: IS200/IS605 family transposase [Bacteroidia bacterium]|jgi:putative transposase|nr:IS200/IS605 family transposase [Bacteroidia bacterium]